MKIVSFKGLAARPRACCTLAPSTFSKQVSLACQGGVLRMDDETNDNPWYSNPGDDRWSKMNSDMIHSLEMRMMILQRLPNISKHPVSRWGTCIQNTWAPGPVLQCIEVLCLGLSSGEFQEFHPGEVNRSKKNITQTLHEVASQIAKTEFCYCDVPAMCLCGLWNAPMPWFWLILSHPEFTPTAVPASDWWNQYKPIFWMTLCHASGHQAEIWPLPHGARECDCSRPCCGLDNSLCSLNRCGLDE